MRKFFYLFAAVALFAACSNDDPDVVKDVTKPVISDGAMPSPVNCEVYKKGQTIPMRYFFSDDKELGGYIIEIHNNFDHHSHSTSAGDCKLDAMKAPVKPFVYNKAFVIPKGTKTYDAKADIQIPKDIDAGDYHFMIRLTDRSGWQQLKAISIKIVDAAD